MHTFSETLFLKVPVIGILRGYSQTQILKIVETYHQEGFTNIEITMNTPDAPQIIKGVSAKYRGKMNVGAGTVLTKADADTVIDAGAQFIVSPVADIPLIEHCVARSVPIFPGASTPTEIHAAWRAGARMVKVFPARSLGPAYIRDVLAPLDPIELMPTGGVTLSNMGEFLQAGAKAFGMGNELFDTAMIEQEDWDGLALHLSKFKKYLDKS